MYIEIKAETQGYEGRIMHILKYSISIVTCTNEFGASVLIFYPNRASASVKTRPQGKDALIPNTRLPCEVHFRPAPAYIEQVEA